MSLALIAALAKNYVIGKDNQLPWHLPADLAYFKSTTMSKPIIMGRKTYISIGRPLPGRQNIVVSRQQDFEAPGCDVVHSIEEALELTREAEEVMLIGGATLFAEALPSADTLYLTWVHANIEGDCYFPQIDFSEWREVSREERPADEKNGYDLSFVVLRRKASKKS